MAEITAGFEGNGGRAFSIAYVSVDLNHFKKRKYSGLQLKEIIRELKPERYPEINDNGIYCLRSIGVVGAIPPKIF